MLLTVVLHTATTTGLSGVIITLLVIPQNTGTLLVQLTFSEQAPAEVAGQLGEIVQEMMIVKPILVLHPVP